MTKAYIIPQTKQTNNRGAVNLLAPKATMNMLMADNEMQDKMNEMRLDIGRCNR